MYNIVVKNFFPHISYILFVSIYLKISNNNIL